MAGPFDFTRDASDITLALTAKHAETPYVLKQYYAEFDATKQNLAQNEIARLMDIPADTHVLLVKWEVLTVEGAARNFAIGDQAGATQFIGSTSGNSLAEGASVSTAAKYYSAANSIDVSAQTSGGLTAIKLGVWVVMLMLKA